MNRLFLAVTVLLLSPLAGAQDASSHSHRSHHSFHFPPNIHIEMDTDEDSDREETQDKDDDDDDDDRRGSGVWMRRGQDEISSQVKASLVVKGPITFRLETFHGDIQVVPSNGNEARITVTDGHLPEVKLVAKGDNELVAEFAGGARLTTGDVRLELPRGSSVDLGTTAGDIKVAGLGGNARLHTARGDIDIQDVANVDANAMSGDIRVGNASGAIRVKTIQGDAQIAANASVATQLDFESTSGDLNFTGACGKGCRIGAASLSGDLHLNLDEKSSFELEFRSHTGDFADALHLNVKDSGRRKHSGGAWVRGTYGQGEGVIEAESFSGDFSVEPGNGNTRADGGSGRSSHYRHGVFAVPIPPILPIPPVPPRPRG